MSTDSTVPEAMDSAADDHVDGEAGTERVAWHLETSWTDLPVRTVRSGTKVQMFSIGVPEDDTAPTVVRAEFLPGARVEPHTHACDYVEIVLEGSEQVGRTWRRAGDVTIVKAGTVYGPLVAGPEGVTKLAIFRDNRSMTIPAAEARAVLDGGREPE